jgi:hypothetical protein
MMDLDTPYGGRSHVRLDTHTPPRFATEAAGIKGLSLLCVSVVERSTVFFSHASLLNVLVDILNE